MSILPDPSFYSRIGRLSSIIFILPASMGVGWILGYYVVDHYLATYPWGTVILILLGAGAGLYEIMKILTLDQQNKSDSRG